MKMQRHHTTLNYSPPNAGLVISVKVEGNFFQQYYLYLRAIIKSQRNIEVTQIKYD